MGLMLFIINAHFISRLVALLDKFLPEKVVSTY